MLKFSKSERIKSKIIINTLFAHAQNIFSFPLKTYYCVGVEIETNQVLISVPKRTFKKAVDRNRIKRLIRESYRKNKEILSPLSNSKLQIAFIYIHKEILSYLEIEKKMILILQKLVSINQK